MKTTHPKPRFMKVPMASIILMLGLFSRLSLNAQTWTAWHSTLSNPYAGYVPLSSFITGNGFMFSPRSISPYSYYWMTYQNLTSICTGSVYALEVRLRNPSPDGIDAYDSSVGIEGSCGATTYTLMGASWAQSFSNCSISHQVNPGFSTTNQPTLVQNLSSYCILRIEVNANNVVYRFNGTQVWSFPFAGGIGEQLNRITISFKGSGSVDYVRIYNASGTLIYDEGFEDTVFPAASPCSFPLSGCPTPLAEGALALVVNEEPEIGFKLAWKNEGSENGGNYTILRSGNGIDFEQIALVPRLDQAPIQTFADTTCLKAAYYKVECLKQDGSVEHSNVVQGKQQIRTGFGCRYQDGKLQVRLRSICLGAEGEFRFRLFDIGGRALLQVDNIDISNGVASIPVELPRGLYVAMASSSNGEVNATKFIVQ